MKKIALFVGCLLLLSTGANAQDKEDLKAQKEAQKEAKANLKKANLTYEMSIPNAQYGRKETNFEKLATAIPLIEAAMQSEYTKNESETWKVGALIQNEYYKKIEAEAKDNPDDAQLQQSFIDCSEKLAIYCVKYDSLLAINPKAKPAEKDKDHKQYQIMGVNPAIQLLQASQNASNSEDQAELAKGARYADEFLNIMQKSNLMKDFKHESLESWITYAKAFRAQSYLGLKDASEAKIVEAYEELMKTNYKGIAYQSLANYYNQKNDKVKQNKYLAEGIEALKGDAEQADLRANFVSILMQNCFQSHDNEGFKKAAAILKADYPKNDNAVNAYLMEGQMEFEEKNYAEAKKIFLEASEKYPEETKCLLMAARSAWMYSMNNGSKKADLDETISLFKKLEAAEPSSPDMWGESLYVLYNNTQQNALAAKYKKYYKAQK